MTRPGLVYHSLKELKAEVAADRSLALLEARADWPWVRSRGTWLSTIDKYGSQCGPHPEADCPEWDGTWRDVLREVDLVQDRPEVSAITISGGYDGGHALEDFGPYGDYAPWVSAWSVIVWTRPKAQEVAA